MNVIDKEATLKEIDALFPKYMQGEPSAEDISALGAEVRDKLVATFDRYTAAVYRNVAKGPEAISNSSTLLALTDLKTGYLARMRAWVGACHVGERGLPAAPESAEQYVKRANIAYGAAAVGATVAIGAAYAQSVPVFGSALVAAIVEIIALLLIFRAKAAAKARYSRQASAYKAELKRAILGQASAWLDASQKESDTALEQLLKITTPKS